MILQTIIQVAAQCGWSVTANVRNGNITSFDFRRNTESGVPFCFSADMTGSKPASLVDDILSFIDAFQPDIFARQWCRISGAGESRYAQTLSDMDGIRTQAWLLAIDLSEAFSARAPHRGISGTDRDYSPLRPRRAIISMMSFPFSRVIPFTSVGLGKCSSWSKQ